MMCLASFGRLVSFFFLIKNCIQVILTIIFHVLNGSGRADDENGPKQWPDTLFGLLLSLFYFILCLISINNYT